MANSKSLKLAIAVAAMLSAQRSDASQIILFDHPDGLSAQAEFTLIDPFMMTIRLRNTSTGVPAGFSNSDQLLTGISFDFPRPGIDITYQINGGSVIIGPASESLNFSEGSFGPGSDVSGEWGFGNMDGSGALPNFVSANAAQATPFGGSNLDGPVNLDGPQGGLVADPPLVSLGGLGAIQDEVVITITVNLPLADLNFLLENGVRVEFGSDAEFITVPEPVTIPLLALATLALTHRRRRSP